MGHLPYTTDSLGWGDPRAVSRAPGAAEIGHLFLAPASVGRGALGVEGGVSLVAGPGMGKTTTLRQLAFALAERRGVATALVALPDVRAHRDAAGFYPYLGAVLASIRRALVAPAAMVRLPEAAREVLSREGDAAASGAVTPPAFERWMGELGAAASRGAGVCLLFDDVDAVQEASWRQAFVAALRFTFQACVGVTPVYALWLQYRDESLAGSNYFRNVTRPVFLAPLASEGRVALARHGLPGAAAADVRRASALVGGHPLLLQRLLADVVDSGWSPDSARPLDALLGAERVEAQRRLVASLLAASPGLVEALRQLEARREAAPVSYRTLPVGLAASGMVDEDQAGHAFVPERIAAGLAGS